MTTASAKSLQDYIDEAPPRSLTTMQWRIWALASTGKFFEGAVVFLTGVALPLITQQFQLSPILKGTVAAATLFGILIGASLFGNLADRYGRRFVFVLELAIFTLFIALTAIAWNVTTLVIFLFCLGVALGADYPTGHMMIAESIPTAYRGRMVLTSFSFQSLGALAGVLLALLMLNIYPEIGAWRWMYAALILPSAIVVWLRMTLPESSAWFLARQDLPNAQKSAERILKRPVKLIATPHPEIPTHHHWLTLFSPRYMRATILTAVPWLLQDLSTYGIGIFTPTILGRLFAQNHTDFILSNITAIEGSGAIDLLLVFGFVISILLVDQLGRIPLQIIGFIGCAIGLLLASLSLGIADHSNLKTVFVFFGFMLFNLMNNLGPNAMTYVLSGEVFPTELRGAGAGFAASFGKVGAVTAAFFFPVLRRQIGTANLLYALVFTSLLGAVITFLFRIETKGKSLEKLSYGKPTFKN